MKPVRFTSHALEQLSERGTNKDEVIESIKKGKREKAKKGRFIYRANYQFNSNWNDRYFSIKQVAPVILESEEELIVITVYTFYY